jgi:phosphoribosylanthranilate isomerase
VLAQHLRFRLADGIVPVGVFVNAPVKEIAETFLNGVISAAQLHGEEDDGYIARLKELCAVNGKSARIIIIKTINVNNVKRLPAASPADYYLLDSSCGTGEAFNRKIISSLKINKPWFLAGGINIDNIKEAAALSPFAVDISSGAEADGVKDRKKILQLVMAARGNVL